MDNIKRLIYGLLIFLVIGAGCKKESGTSDLPLTATDFQNISYGSSSRNKLDIYLPENRTAATPVVLLIHGGSWVEGDKSSFTDLAKYWRDRGFAAATVNYRLTNTVEKNIHPAQVNDVEKAIQFIGSKSGEWKISGDKFALLGASAGGHLALLHSYKYDAGNKVKTVISMAGPTDLTQITNAGPAQTQVVQWLIGASLQAAPQAYAQASPVTHVSATAKPTLLFHGKLDVVVPYQQSVELNTKLKQAGVATKLVLYEDTGHEVINLNHTMSFLADCEAWFRLYLK
jgi:acetyl esterase/lipase